MNQWQDRQELRVAESRHQAVPKQRSRPQLDMVAKLPILERKYRENLNAKMNQLQQAIFGTDYFSREGSQLLGEVTAVNGAKLRKGVVIASIIDYIQHTDYTIVNKGNTIDSTSRNNSIHDLSIVPLYSSDLINSNMRCWHT
jgi:hypothetical protein